MEVSMKNIRFVLIVSSVIGVAGLVFAAYSVFFGPDPVDFSGMTFWEWIRTEEGLPVIIVPVVLIISGFMMRPLLRIIFPPSIKNAMTAPARVLKVWDTGVSINDNPQVGMLLEVTPSLASPFQVETKSVVSRLNAALVQPGITAEVRYDAQKPKRLEIVSLNIDTQMTMDASDRMEELLDLRSKALISEEEYQVKREEILKNL
jgi:hypothetical protein